MVGRRGRVIWTEHARDALTEIITYIAQDSAAAARSVAEELVEAAASLDTLADRGRVVAELEDPTIRELLVRSYRVIYEIRPEEVRILTLVHQARDFARIARRPPPSGPAG